MVQFVSEGKTSKIVIFGGGEIAELAKYYFDIDSSFQVVAFAVDDEFYLEKEFKGIPVIPWSKVLSEYPPSQFGMHVALSYRRLNRVREAKYRQCKAAGYSLVSYISSKATVFPDLVHGENCFILENQNIQPGVMLGENVMLWSGNHIGHGATINSHAYLASHVVISGHVNVGQRSFIGVNATVRDFVSIGEDSFVGMSSVVTKDLSPGSVVLPARSEVIRGEDPKAKRIIQTSFGNLED